MALYETDQVIEDFLGDSPRATEWRAMHQALSDRLKARRQQREEEAAAGADVPRLHALDLQIASLERQVTALKTEEAVTQFVEDSIKVTLAKAQPDTEDEA
jgi:LmbE family N-acetylglucosaminyl deacetylase